MSTGVRFSFLGLISGILGGLGLVVLLQQFSVIYPTAALAVAVVVVWVLLSSIVLPSLAGGRRTAPAPGPAAVASDTVVEEAPVVEDTSTSFRPTHAVPISGLDATEDRDGTGPPLQLDAGLEVEVLESVDGRAHIRGANGWEGWTDAAALEARP